MDSGRIWRKDSEGGANQHSDEFRSVSLRDRGLSGSKPSVWCTLSTHRQHNRDSSRTFLSRLRTQFPSVRVASFLTHHSDHTAPHRSSADSATLRRCSKHIRDATRAHCATLTNTNMTIANTTVHSSRHHNTGGHNSHAHHSPAQPSLHPHPHPRLCHKSNSLLELSQHSLCCLSLARCISDHCYLSATAISYCDQRHSLPAALSPLSGLAQSTTTLCICLSLHLSALPSSLLSPPWPSSVRSSATRSSLLPHRPPLSQLVAPVRRRPVLLCRQPAVPV